jgi:Heterokaryon incompatibility protein (HET)
MSYARPQSHDVQDNRKRKRDDKAIDNADHSTGINETNGIADGSLDGSESSTKNYSSDSTLDGKARSSPRERERYRTFAADESDQSVNRRDSSSLIHATSSVGKSTSATEVQGQRSQASPNAADPDFEYKSLPPGAIRILTVHPGSDTSDLDCSFTIREKDESGHYETLSYVWGTDPPSCPLRIRSSDDGFRNLRITINLMSALKQLRNSSSPRRFWIDAICINQSSEHEKSHQVPLMSKIYSEASNVCVWIGEDDADSPLALALIQKIQFLKDYDRVVEDQTLCTDWIALTNLMRQKWFSRRWVVQELALAQNATLHCGKYKIPWSDFAEAVALFEVMAPRVKRKFRESRDYNQHPDFIGDVTELSASRLVANTNNLVRKSDDGHVLMKLFTLESLVSRLIPFKATQAHDIIYAVLSLAKDIPGSAAVITPTTVIRASTTRSTTAPDNDAADSRDQDLLKRLRVADHFRVEKYPVDYGKSFYEVCRDFLKFSTKQSNSLDMICRPWAPVENRGGLPSWIRTTRDASYGLRVDGYWSRKNPDTLVGQPGESNYSASGKYPGEWTFGEDVNVPSLLVRGFVLDQVRRVEDPARSGAVPKTWFETYDQDKAENGPPEWFWRTMVADRDPNRNSTPGYYARAWAHTANERVEGGDVETGQIVDRNNISLLETFLRRVQSVVWNRRLTFTKKQKLKGLTPEDTRKGDLICILPGCSVPVVLRKVRPNRRGQEDESSEPGDPHYIFLGECYIHNMMEGEAFAVKNKFEIDYQTFEIR